MTPFDDSRTLDPQQMVSVLMDRIRSFAPEHRPRRTSSYVGLERDASPDNFVVLRERAYGLRADIKLPADAPAVAALEAAGIHVHEHRPYTGGPGIHPMKVTPRDLVEHLDLLSNALEVAYRDHSKSTEDSSGPATEEHGG